MDFSLCPGDVVRITIDQIGTLTNTVVTGKNSFSWLTASIADVIATGTMRRTPAPLEPS
jgi:fumarylacetoacetate (FAA) hydrolase family protein